MHCNCSARCCCCSCFLSLSSFQLVTLWQCEISQTLSINVMWLAATKFIFIILHFSPRYQDRERWLFSPIFYCFDFWVISPSSLLPQLSSNIQMESNPISVKEMGNFHENIQYLKNLTENSYLLKLLMHETLNEI